MKKIVFVMNSLSTGGAEKVLVNILNYLSKEKYDVTLLTVFDNSSLSNILSPKIKRRSIVYIKNRYCQGIIYKMFSKVLSPEQLYKKIVKEKYDIEIAFLEGLPTKIISGSDNLTSKKIAWVHTDLMSFRDSDYCFENEERQKQSYEKFNEIISVSYGVKQAFEERFHINIDMRVLYNLVDENEVSKKSRMPLTLSSPYKGKGFRFISVGRLHHQKGYERLIEACYILKKQNIEFEVCIVGDGVQRESLQELIEKRHLSEFVYLYGYTNNPYQLIVQADCMVISSYAEGFPLVAVEALILGIPIISTNVTGPQEVLENGRWGMLTENNIESIAESMKKMIKPKVHEKYMDLARERGQQFKIHEAVEAIENLFDNL